MRPESSQRSRGDRERTTRPSLHRPRRQRRRRAGDAGRGGRCARRRCPACGCAASRRLYATAPVGRHRPARVPERRRRPGRPGGPDPATGAVACSPAQGAGALAGRRAAAALGPARARPRPAGVRAPPDRRRAAGRGALDRRRRRPGEGRPTLEVPHRAAGERLFVLAPSPTWRRARAARLARDRRDAPATRRGHRAAGRRRQDRPLERRPRGWVREPASALARPRSGGGTKLRRWRRHEDGGPR